MNTISISGRLGYQLETEAQRPTSGARQVPKPGEQSLHSLWMAQRSASIAERTVLCGISVIALGSMAYGISFIPALIERWPVIEAALNRLIQ